MNKEHDFYYDDYDEDTNDLLERNNSFGIIIEDDDEDRSHSISIKPTEDGEQVELEINEIERVHRFDNIITSNDNDMNDNNDKNNNDEEEEEEYFSIVLDGTNAPNITTSDTKKPIEKNIEKDTNKEVQIRPEKTQEDILADKKPIITTYKNKTHIETNSIQNLDTEYTKYSSDNNIDHNTLVLPGGKRTAFDVEIETLEEKPWRKQNVDISDYFNYGFDEYTWKIYAKKQQKIRRKIAIKKLNESKARTAFLASENIEKNTPPPTTTPMNISKPPMQDKPEEKEEYISPTLNPDHFFSHPHQHPHPPPRIMIPPPHIMYNNVNPNNMFYPPPLMHDYYYHQDNNNYYYHQEEYNHYGMKEEEFEQPYGIPKDTNANVSQPSNDNLEIKKDSPKNSRMKLPSKKNRDNRSRSRSRLRSRNKREDDRKKNNKSRSRTRSRDKHFKKSKKSQERSSDNSRRRAIDKSHTVKDRERRKENYNEHGGIKDHRDFKKRSEKSDRREKTEKLRKY